MLEINEKTIETLEKVLKNLLLKMGIEAKFFTKIIDAGGKEMININIKTKDADLLIGSKGATLSALQYLTRVLFSRLNKNEIVPFVLDINNYKIEKEEYLKNMAHNLARKVKLTKKSITLPAMPAYERRIIHLALADDKEIKTESEGEEPNRKIIIKPVTTKINLEEKIAEIK